MRVREINRAEIQYQTTYPEVGFAAKLSNLGGAAPCEPSAAHACLLDDSLAQATTAPGKAGYIFAAVGETVNGANGVNVKLFATATPVKANRTGVRSFCSVEDMVVREQPSGAEITSPDACLALTPIL